MKKQFFERPAMFDGREFYGFDWFEHLTAIPAPLALVTSFKDNGKTNATMQSWLSFSNEDAFYCIFSSVNRYQHMYETIKKTGQLVINFPSADVYRKCHSTIFHNRYEDDELESAGLTYEIGTKVNAPVVNECFLNIECEYVWEKELYPGSKHVVMCVRAVNLWMDDERYNSDKLGRYGETGYLYNIHSPLNPETGVEDETAIAILQNYKTYPELQ